MKKYENFVPAFENLRDIYDYNEPYGNVELNGLVGLFEVCFEQSWKLYEVQKGKYRKGNSICQMEEEISISCLGKS